MRVEVLGLSHFNFGSIIYIYIYMFGLLLTSIFVLDFPATRVILRRKRGRAVW